MPTKDLHAVAAGTWTLGDRAVNRIGFGAKRLHGSGTFDIGKAGDRERVVKLLRRAVELGVNHIDTAAFYPTYAHPAPRTMNHFQALNWANEMIREALAPYPDELLIATKVGPAEGGLARPDQLRGLVEENLRQLGVEQLGLVNLRQHGLESIAEHFGALADLRDAGLIQHLGISNVRPHHLAQAQAIAPVACVQNRLGVDFGRNNDDLLHACGERGIAFVPFFTLASANREAGGVADNDTVAAVARAHGASPAQIRIAWALSRGPHVLAIPGTGSPRHLVENVAAGAIRLTREDLALLG